MKKSTLLSLLTAASIVVTTAGTYAAWDSIEASTTEEITFRNPVTVTVNSDYILTENPGSLGEIPTASGDVVFTVSNDKSLADTLTIIPKVSGGNSASLDDFDFVIKDKNNSSNLLSGDKSSGFVDNTLDSTTYTVEVTPKDASKAKIAGTPVNIQLTATLSKSN